MGYRVGLSVLAYSMMFSAAVLAQNVTGSGTPNLVPKFTGSTTIGNSAITESSGNVGIGTGTPLLPLDVNGSYTVASTTSTPNGSVAVGSSATSLVLTMGVESTNYTSWLQSRSRIAASGMPIVLNPIGGNVGIGTGSSPSYMLDVGLGSATRWSSWNDWGAGAAAANVFTGPGVQKINSRSSLYAVVAARNPGTSFSLFIVPWDGVNGLETNCNQQINSGWHAQGAVKGNYVYQEFDGSDFTRYSSVLLSQAGFDDHKSSGTQWWIGCSTLAPFSQTANGSQWVTSSSSISYNDGNVGVGTSSPAVRLEVNGSMKLTNGSGGSITFADGTTQNTAWTGSLCGGDYAESVDVSGSSKSYRPGDVLVIAGGFESDVRKSTEPYSPLVAGIYSTKPGMVGKRFADPERLKNQIPMAMVGIVPVNVTDENGPIKRGDLLVTSAKEGYAMKGTDRSRMFGAVIGKAMGSLESGTGVIEVLVSLQ